MQHPRITVREKIQYWEVGWNRGLHFVLMKLSEKKRYTFVISYDWSFSYVKMDTAALLHKNLQIFIFLASLFPFSIKKLYWCFARPWLSNGTNFIGFPKVFQKLQRLVKCVQWMKNRTLIVFSLAAILYLYKRHLCLDVFVSRTGIALSKYHQFWFPASDWALF